MASHGHSGHGHTVTVLPPNKEKIWKIWKTMIILAIVTAIEFVLAFTMDRGPVLTSIFVILTFIKTFYIVGEFMHLKYEVKVLIWSISLPMLFIVWLITSQLMEGNAVHILRVWWTTIGGIVN
jgi:cytochrome c oxidase subunit IV